MDNILTSNSDPTEQSILQRILKKDRRTIAKAITLIESSADEDKECALNLLKSLPINCHSQRIAFSGPPGAGKSTLIDEFGSYLIQQGKTVAVLTIDPSAQSDGAMQGGSLLGDKTRMVSLGKNPQAFIRPSPSRSGVLGGATTTTADVIRLLEAAQYDVILVETIGTGQNEIDASFLTDLIILVLAPAAGDALQGIKRGILEYADIILVNKDDGDLKKEAELTAQAYFSAIKNKGQTILKCSALNKTGFQELDSAINRYYDAHQQDFAQNRSAQEIQQFKRRIEQEWPNIISQTPFLTDLVQKLTQEIQEHNSTPREGCERFYKIVTNLLTKAP